MSVKFFDKYESMMEDVSPNDDYNYWNKSDALQTSMSQSMTRSQPTIMNRLRDSMQNMFSRQRTTNASSHNLSYNDDKMDSSMLSSPNMFQHKFELPQKNDILTPLLNLKNQKQSFITASGGGGSAVTNPFGNDSSFINKISNHGNDDNYQHACANRILVLEVKGSFG